MACDGSLIFFLMSGDSGDGGGLVVDVRDNLADFYLFRSISVVCSFFCFKKSLKIPLKKQ